MVDRSGLVGRSSSYPTAVAPPARVGPQETLGQHGLCAIPAKLPRMMNASSMRNTRNRRILIVDGDSAIHTEFREALENPSTDLLPAGAADSSSSDASLPSASTTEFVVDAVTQGPDAVHADQEAVLAGRPFAAAFVDVGLAGDWDGIDTVQRMCEVDSHLQFVLCTDPSDNSWHDRFGQLTMADGIVLAKKPLSHIQRMQLALSLTEKWNVSRQARLQLRELESLLEEQANTIRRCEARSEAILNASADAIIAIDEHGAIETFNTTAETVFGYAAEEVLGRNISMLATAAEGTAHDEFVRLYREEGNSNLLGVERELSARRKDGTTFPVAVRVSEMYYQSQRRFIGIVQDITLRKQAEAALRRFRVALDCSADALFLIDRTTMRFIDMNQSACNELGYSREELLALGPQDITLNGDLETLAKWFDNVIAGDESARVMETQHRHKDGSTLPVEVLLQHLPTEDGPVIIASARDITERQQAQITLQYQASHDALTDVFERRYFRRLFDEEWARTRRYGHTLSCVLLDIDFFKTINDTHGHAAGDTVLQKVAEVLRRQCRTSDRICRYGGEEFCILLPETNEADAAAWAERARKALAASEIPIGERSITLTASFGVAEARPDTPDPHHLIDRADEAVLHAKRSGRNQVVCSQSLEDPLSGLMGDGTSEHPLDTVTAADVMTPLVFCLKQDHTVQYAADFFLQLRLGSAPVVDHEGKLVGIVSEKDLITVTVTSETWGGTLRDVMTTSVVSYDEDAPARQILDFLDRAHIRSIVVVRDQHPTGVISRATLLRWFCNWLAVNYETQDRERQLDEASHIRDRAKRAAEAIAHHGTSLPNRLGDEVDDFVPTVIGEASRMQELINDLLGHCKSPLSP